MAVADGAGSAKWGAKGAHIAANAATLAAEQNTHLPMAELLSLVLWQARQALEALVSPHEHEPPEEEVWSWFDTPEREPPKLRDFATTLLVAVIAHGQLGVMQVGDGVVVAIPEQGDAVCLTQPVRGEYINQTIFVTSSNYTDYLQSHIHPLDGVAAVALMSDGVEQVTVVKASNTPHPPFFASLLGYLRSKGNPEQKAQDLCDFLASPKVCQHTDDDKTLLVAFRP